MIDTDKYEGHTPGPWKTNPNDLGTRIDGSSNEEIATVHNYAPANRANRELIADAPLLLAEVKRLKTRLFHAEKYLCGIEWECYKDAIRFTLKEEITERMRSSD